MFLRYKQDLGQLYNVGSLKSLRSLFYFELNLLVLFQSLIAFGLDCGKMYEYIIAALYGDKSESLLRIKPLNSSGHADTSSKL